MRYTLPGSLYNTVETLFFSVSQEAKMKMGMEIKEMEKRDGRKDRLYRKHNKPNTVETVFFTVSQKYKGVRNHLGCGIGYTTVSVAALNTQQSPSALETSAYPRRKADNRK